MQIAKKEADVSEIIKEGKRKEDIAKMFKLLAHGIPQSVAVVSAGINYTEWKKFRDNNQEFIRGMIRIQRGKAWDIVLDDLYNQSAKGDVRATALIARTLQSKNDFLSE